MSSQSKSKNSEKLYYYQGFKVLSSHLVKHIKDSWFTK